MQLINPQNIYNVFEKKLFAILLFEILCLFRRFREGMYQVSIYYSKQPLITLTSDTDIFLRVVCFIFVKIEKLIYSATIGYIFI